MRALTEAGCIRIITDKKSDKKSGKNAEREELWKVLDHLRECDTLVVPSLDRLGRSVQDLIATVSGLRTRHRLRLIARGARYRRTRRSPPLPRFASLAEPPSPSANSSSRAPTRAWKPPAPAAPDLRHDRETGTSCPATCSPPPGIPSRPSRSSSA
ncbi:recombinase family protein [Streptomyces sp. NPDC056638]|uniref:recombinase family protein n=1 Tax=Streptomyces sp. NPDC056638 TaxID=3345887 RepID=UPI0036AC96F0